MTNTLKVINEAVDGMIVTSNQETTQEKIINLIKKNPSITQVEMAKILDLTTSSDYIKQQMIALRIWGIEKNIHV